MELSDIKTKNRKLIMRSRAIKKEIHRKDICQKWGISKQQFHNMRKSAKNLMSCDQGEEGLCFSGSQYYDLNDEKSKKLYEKRMRSANSPIILSKSESVTKLEKSGQHSP